MEELVYHAKGVDKCELASRFRVHFSKILKKDYPGRNFGFSQRVLESVCIDMDAVEKCNGGQFDRTMDCVVGVSDYDDVHGRHSGHRLMMVELKLGCIGFSLKPGYLNAKVSHTSLLLSGNMLERHKCFIFPHGVIAEAKRRLNQWKRGKEKLYCCDWVFLKPEDYNDFLHFAEDFPYKPVTRREDVLKSFKDARESPGKIVKVRNYWLTLAIKYRNQGVRQEYEHIRGIVDEIVTTIIGEMADGDDKELLKLEFQMHR